jgi:hypothetical protein
MWSSSAILPNVDLLDAMVLDQILATNSKILNDTIPDHVASILTTSLQENLRSMLCISLFHNINMKLNILESCKMCQIGQHPLERKTEEIISSNCRISSGKPDWIHFDI